MFPFFILFGKVISTYMLASLVGIFASGVFACYYARKKYLDSIEMLIMLLIAAAGGLVGSHMLYGIVNYRYIVILTNNIDKITSFKMLFNSLTEIFGGSVFYGGLIGGIIAGYIYAIKQGLDIYKYADIAAVSIPLMHTFGRIGCFLGGCCYGVESDIGYVYTCSLIEEANGVSRFPIQLLESSLNLILFFILFYLLRKSFFSQRLIYLYLCIYSIMRFILEFWRGDNHRGFIFGISTSQFISILIFIASVYAYINKSVNMKKTKNISNEI